MRIDGVEWTPDRVEHIAQHAVAPEEVEEVFVSAPLFKRGKGGVYEAWGRTESGRRVRDIKVEILKSFFFSGINPTV